MPEPINVDEVILELEAPLRKLAVLGRANVEDILEMALDDVFEADDDE